ncbi:MAG: GGDEF domain-containing protein [Armatimonadetes bacterium]|nr:GGDEF domain-containing protein [Armatimonadota bacterium]
MIHSLMRLQGDLRARDVTRWLKRLGLWSLVVLVSLEVTGQIIADRTFRLDVQESQQVAKIVNQSASALLAGQELTKYVTGGLSPAQEAKLLNQFRDMAPRNDAILQFTKGRTWRDDESGALLATRIDNDFKSIWRNVRTLTDLKLSPADKATEARGLQESMRSYGQALALISYRISEDQVRLREFSKYVQIGEFLLFLATVGAMYWGMVLPLMKRLTGANEELQAKAFELEGLNARLEHGKKQLAEQNLRLQLQQADLSVANEELEYSHSLYADAARRLEDLFQRVPVACFSYDAEGTIHEWNRAAETVFGLGAHEVTDRPIHEVFGAPEDTEALQQLLRAPLNGDTVQEFRWAYPLPGKNKPKWIQSSTFPIVDHEGNVRGALCASVDFTERFEFEAQIEANMIRINEYSIELELQREELLNLNRQLEGLASTDGLTGLRNHRNFQERLELNFQVSKAEQLPLSILLMDVDNFKKFNDSFGHQAGDDVLRSVARVLRKFENESITIARYGGEEFVVVLPGYGEGEAMKMAEEMRAAIEECCPTGRKVTCSIGVSVYGPALRSRAELIAQADKALYASKEAGRNRVTLASSTWKEEAA